MPDKFTRLKQRSHAKATARGLKRAKKHKTENARRLLADRSLTAAQVAARRVFKISESTTPAVPTAAARVRVSLSVCKK